MLRIRRCVTRERRAARLDGEVRPAVSHDGRRRVTGRKSPPSCALPRGIAENSLDLYASVMMQDPITGVPVTLFRAGADVRSAFHGDYAHAPDAT
ncbi:MAG: hypothetical protein RL701_2027 [Pseudomonadota bacterium]